MTNIYSSRQESDWVINYSILFHVTHCDFFTPYCSGGIGSIKMGNNGTSKIRGIEDIYLETNLRTKLLLKDVRHQCSRW